jgi:hypothetical protein
VVGLAGAGSLPLEAQGMMVFPLGILL